MVHVCFGQIIHQDEILKAIEEKFDAIVVMDNASSLPHRVICDPIKLANKITGEDHLKGLLETFLSDNWDSFGIDVQTIRKRSIHKVGKTYYADFYQVYNGKEVLDTEIIFRVNENGNLFMFGMDYYRDISVKPFKEVTKSSILNSLQKKFDHKLRNDIEYDFKRAYILPVWKTGKLQFLPVQQIHASNGDQISEIIFINQKDATIEKSIHKCLHGYVNGTCSAHILPTIPTENQVNRKLPFIELDINGDQVITDENGSFKYSTTSSLAPLQATLNGKYVSLQNFNGPNAKIEMNLDCDEDVSLLWDDSNSTLSERNVYYHITKMHQYNKDLDSNFVGLDYPLQCIVNDNSAFCNAYWNGNNLHFNTQDANCAMNSAHGASVVYHEYGHAVNDRLYNQIGHPWGMKNPILQEAFSDIYSTLLLNDSRFALGWFGPGTMTRNLNNSNRYPNSVIGQQHTDGLILGGAFWDLGQLTSAETAYRLSHLAKYGAPDDEDIAMAFAEVLLETLVADDDDGNLINGSPNSQAILDAFCNHGIGSDLLISQKLLHAEHPNTLNTIDDYQIVINLPQLNIGTDYNHLTLVYSTDNFISYDRILMEENGEFEYIGFIPSAIEGTLIKYYFEVLDSDCSALYYHPSQDYRSEYYSFLVGTFEEVFIDDFEEDKNWQLSNVSDNATSGRWQRGIPQEVINDIGQLVSPGSDNSEEGEKCMVTGAGIGNIWYANDVDGGKTTITSPIFTNLEKLSVFEFYKWFTHGSGFVFPAQGLWKIQVSNNGLNWITIEQTSYGDHRNWIKGMYRFSDFIEITDQVQVRFEVSDFGQGSIVEGLIDDFIIYNFEDVTSALDEPKEDLMNIFPNPSYGVVNIILNESIGDDMDITLYTIDGESVNFGILKSEKVLIQLDVSNLKGGIFILCLKNNEQLFSQRILII